MKRVPDDIETSTATIQGIYTKQLNSPLIQSSTPPHSSRSFRKQSASTGEADNSDDLTDYFSVASLTHRSQTATNDETFNSVRSRASLEDALWSDDDEKNDTTDLSTSRSEVDLDPSRREKMRLLAASQEYRLLLTKGYEMHKQGNTAEALRVYTTVLEASRALNDPDLQSQALTRLGLLYQRTYTDTEAAAGRIQRVFRGHMGRHEAR